MRWLTALGLARADALAPGLALAPAEADASGDAEGSTDGLGVGAGTAGSSRVSLVRISMKPSPLLVTIDLDALGLEHVLDLLAA